MIENHQPLYKNRPRSSFGGIETSPFESDKASSSELGTIKSSLPLPVPTGGRGRSAALRLSGSSLCPLQGVEAAPRGSDDAETSDGVSGNSRGDSLGLCGAVTGLCGHGIRDLGVILGVENEESILGEDLDRWRAL
jgi:hypothetical protein